MIHVGSSLIANAVTRDNCCQDSVVLTALILAIALAAGAQFVVNSLAAIAAKLNRASPRGDDSLPNGVISAIGWPLAGGGIEFFGAFELSLA
jgi:hypothetical protein